MVQDQLLGLAAFIFRALDRAQHGLIAAGHEQQQALAWPIEGRHQLGTVLHGKPPGGAGAGIDEPSALV
jgi:hypothetical protein